MTRVNVIAAYGNRQVAAMIQALACEIGGPDAVRVVDTRDARVTAEFATPEQAKEFHEALERYLPAYYQIQR